MGLGTPPPGEPRSGSGSGDAIDRGMSMCEGDGGDDDGTPTVDDDEGDSEAMAERVLGACRRCSAVCLRVRLFVCLCVCVFVRACVCTCSVWCT
jgi:hypothetical protein